MNPTDLALEASAMITSSGSGDSGLIADLTPSQKRRVAADLTATMQAIYTLNPAIYKRSMGADFAAPVSASITVTNGSDLVTTAQAFGEGCSVYVGGIMNEIRTEGGIQRLRFPFIGADGAQTAVFYDDCKILAPNIAQVMNPVSIADSRCPLTKLDNRAQAEEWRRRTGTPERYWVEPFLLGSSTTIYPDTLTVSGTMTPDGTGAYGKLAGVLSGDDNNLPVYARIHPNDTYVDFILRFNYGLGGTGLWAIQAAANLAGGYWAQAGGNLLGTYTPGTYTGSPVVTSNGVGITDGDNPASTLRLRILPIPKAQTTIGYDVALCAPKFTVADLGTDAVPSTKSLVVAEGYHELFVRPIFLQMWAGSAWFPENAALRKRVAQDDQAARTFLRDYKPQQASNRRITAPL